MEPIIFQGIESRTLPEELQNLSRLPREIVHQILEELYHDEVLHILSYNHGYLNSYIVTSRTYKSLLRPYDPMVDPSQSIANLSTTIKTLHASLRNFHVPQKGHFWRLLTYENGTDKFYLLGRRILVADALGVASKIARSIHVPVALDERQISIYRPYTTQSYNTGEDIYSQEYDVLLDRWTWITKTWFSMRKSKSRQLNIAADLLLEFPGKIKRPRNPVKECPPPNIGHTARGWRANAKKYAESNILPHFRTPKCIHGAELIELIPYDRYLKRFLGILDKCPPQTSGSEDLVQFNELSLRCRTQAPYVYPESIMKDLNFVIYGQYYVYTRNDSSLSLESTGLKQQIFVDQTQHFTSTRNLTTQGQIVVTAVLPSTCPMMRENMSG
jgi:hypothetical protein